MSRSSEFSSGRVYQPFNIPLTKESYPEWEDKVIEATKLAFGELLLLGLETEPLFADSKYGLEPPSPELAKLVTYTLDGSFKILLFCPSLTPLQVHNIPVLIKDHVSGRKVKDEAAVLFKAEYADYWKRRTALFSSLQQSLGIAYEHLVRDEATGNHDPAVAWKAIKAEFAGSNVADTARMLAEFMAIRSTPNEPLPKLLDRITVKNSMLRKAKKEPDAGVKQMLLHQALPPEYYEVLKTCLVNNRNASFEDQLLNQRE
jgi:hypothetical protein